eukprot:550752-Rhodomonas_salina.2
MPWHVTLEVEWSLSQRVLSAREAIVSAERQLQREDSELASAVETVETVERHDDALVLVASDPRKERRTSTRIQGQCGSKVEDTECQSLGFRCEVPAQERDGDDDAAV